MKFKAVFVVLALLALVGCKPTDEDIANSAKEQINRSLKDPTSSLFRDVVVYRDGENSAYVCGEVNAKNNYGAYTGFETFAANVVITKDEIVPIVDFLKDYSFDSFTPFVCTLKGVDEAKKYLKEMEADLKKQENDNMLIEQLKEKNAECVKQNLNETDIKNIDKTVRRKIELALISTVISSGKMAKLPPDASFYYAIESYCDGDELYILSAIQIYRDGAEILEGEDLLNKTDVFVFNKETKEITSIGSSFFTLETRIEGDLKAKEIYNGIHNKSRYIKGGFILAKEISF